MASLELDLLGEFQARAAGVSVDVPGRKERALLAVLALPPGERRSRDKLAGLLWSDRGEKQARDSLKSALSRLKEAFGSLHPLPIVSERECVSLDREKVAVDVAVFEHLISEGTPGSIAQATALYRGDLLDGLDVRDPAFEEWLLLERQRLRVLVRDALGRLLDQRLASGARDSAATVAHRLLQLDPLREGAHRALMQIYAEQGQTALALKQYQFCRDTLQRELGVKPEAETIRLYESIRQRRAAPTSSPGSLRTEADSPPKPEPVDLPLPSKPSIAVLPFLNLSGDPEQEYFADGMVEEIIGALSRMRWLFVTARNSSFTYKGRAVDVKQVGRELGVRYVLEGSVRRAGNRVRIASELIDTSMGANLWADRFEGSLEDVFDLQDQVTTSVIGAIAPKLEQAEIERAEHKPTESLHAYDCYLRGMAGYHRWTREGNNDALSHFYRAIELDRNFAPAYGMAAGCYIWRKANGWMADRAQDIAEAGRLARRAVEIGKDDPVALCWGGMTIVYVVGNPEDGAAFIDQALKLDPNYAAAWSFSGWARIWLGEPEVAIQHVERAMRLSPLDPLVYNRYSAFGFAHFLAGRYDEACAWAERAMRAVPTYATAVRTLAASNALAGRMEEAQKAIARLRQLDPAFRISSLRDLTTFRRPADFARYAEGLRKAGLPE